MIKHVFIFIVFSWAVYGCTPVVAVKKGYDFSQIKKVAVIPFEGSGVSGKVVADDFIRQLLIAGMEVVEREHVEQLMRENSLNVDALEETETMQTTAQTLGVDAFFTGTVSQFKSDQRFLILMENDGNLVKQPVIQLNSDTYRKEERFDEDSIVIYIGAAVSVSARLVDARTGSVVWAHRATYEALESSHAVSSIIDYFIQSLKPYLKFNKG